MKGSNAQLELLRSIQAKKSELENQIRDIEDISTLGLRIKIYRNNIGTTPAKEFEVDQDIARDAASFILKEYQKELKNMGGL